MDNELLDLVDQNDTPIGTINRADANRLKTENLGYIRAADMFLLNPRGEIYVPVRGPHKTIAPNGYDYSVGGHVAAGEDYLTAVIREAKEELGLDLTAGDLELVAKVVSDNIRYISSIFLARTAQEPVINPEDFTSAAWMPPAELLQKIDAGHPAKSNLRETVVLLQKYLAGR